jgi:hypothetical protein
MLNKLSGINWAVDMSLRAIINSLSGRGRYGDSFDEKFENQHHYQSKASQAVDLYILFYAKCVDQKIDIGLFRFN